MKKQTKTCNFYNANETHCIHPPFKKGICFWHTEISKSKENIIKFRGDNFDLAEFLSNLDTLEGFYLKEAILHGIDLSGKNLSRADFCESQMPGANLSDCFLGGTIFYRTNLSHANLKSIHLNGPFVYDKPWKVMRGLPHLAIFTNFSECSLEYTDFENADLRRAILDECDLTKANLHNAILINASLKRANLFCANLEGADFRATELNYSNLAAITYNNKSTFLFCKIEGIEWNNNPLLKRHIEDQNFLYAYKNKNIISKIIYYLWFVTSYCGRSLSLWGLWSLAIALVFGFLYRSNPDWFLAKDPNSLTYFYFSIMIFSTFGFGEVTPLTITGQIWVMFEVVLGYMMLGGLISIFSNKLARRA